MLDRPICIIGAARSGTTVLGSLLAQHPDVAYWEEPKYVWRYRNPTATTDVRTSDEATPTVRRYIRNRLSRRVQRGNGGSRLLEKTPSNCFRVPFVHAVLPDVRIIHLIRDGRDVAFSARKLWRRLNEGQVEEAEKSGQDLSAYERFAAPIWERLRSLEVPWRDVPFYAVRYAKTVLFGREEHLWGPRFPGIRTIAASEDLLEVCAVQWRESVRHARKGLRSVPEDQQKLIRFEALVRRPSEVLPQVLDFAELPNDPALVERARERLRADAAGQWKKRDKEEVRRVLAQAGPLIRELDEERTID